MIILNYRKEVNFMSPENILLSYANRLEGLLIKYLDCHYLDFGVKANDGLTIRDWRTPIAFALGHKYASSNNSPEVKEKIDYFLGDVIKGKYMSEVVNEFEKYGFESQEKAYEEVDNIINSLEEILND